MDSNIVNMLYGAGLVLGTILVGLIVGWLFGLRRDMQRVLSGIDQDLVAFGRSEAGKLANYALQTGRGYVDESDDALVVALSGTLQSINLLKKSGVKITPEAVSGTLVRLVDGFIELTDGKTGDTPAPTA